REGRGQRLGGGRQGGARVDDECHAVVGDDVGVRVVVGRERGHGHRHAPDVLADPLRRAAHCAPATRLRASSNALAAGTSTLGTTPRPSHVGPRRGARTPVAIQACEPSLRQNGSTASTLPAVLSPTIVARPASCSAPARPSAALFTPPSTST